jgi:hypothetical protein
MKHKVTTKRSPKYADMVEANCTCGWYEHATKTSAMTGSMQVVRRELNYLVQDHLDEAKAAN